MQLEVYSELRLPKTTQSFGILGDRIFLTSSTGDQELLELKAAERQLYLVEFVKEFDHEKTINGIDSLSVAPDKRLVVTCSDDGYVKIWNEHRQLIRQVHFPYRLLFAHFLGGSGDILISYSNSVSVLRFETYFPKDFQPEPFEGLLRACLRTEVEFTIKIVGNDIGKELANYEYRMAELERKAEQDKKRADATEAEREQQKQAALLEQSRKPEMVSKAASLKLRQERGSKLLCEGSKHVGGRPAAAVPAAAYSI
ncbi:MAG: hypothetical protein P4M11_13760 [Candidatus Pacebacteria bacterium]|nr:hypothetical protein [Candidatus Paceibacterota bacterium]